MTTRYPVTVLPRAVALLRQGTAKVPGDDTETGSGVYCGTSLQHKAKSSIHHRQCPHAQRPRTERCVFTPGGLPRRHWPKIKDDLLSGQYRLLPLRWIIRRLRFLVWKQWKNPHTKVRNLKKLGIDHQHAVLSIFL